MEKKVLIDIRDERYQKLQQLIQELSIQRDQPLNMTDVIREAVDDYVIRTNKIKVRSNKIVGDK